jgi:hypothetical protein
VYPESDLSREFWHFVWSRACDPRKTRDDPPAEITPYGSGALNRIEDRRNVVAWDLSEGNNRGLREHEIRDPAGFNVAYDSLQDALLAFLIYQVSDGDFPYDYRTWLRTVVLIVMDVARDPERLTVIVPVTDSAGDILLDPTSSTRHEHVMTLEGSWDCLSRDTFNTIKGTPANAR